KSKCCSTKCAGDNRRGIARVPSRGRYKETRTENGKGMLAHRYAMSKYLGRPLHRGEVIHHINGDKGDNRIENLMVMTPQAHSEHHNQKHPRVKFCAVCGAEYVPPAKHRERTKTCSKKCRYMLVSWINRQPSFPNSMYREGAYP